MKEFVHLDELDRKILRLVQRRGDMSLADLSREVGASSASCWRRLRALEAAEVIGASVRLLNAVAIGRGLDVLCQVRMKAHDLEARRDFERFIEGREEVMECYSMSGEWDYLLRVVVGDVREYEHFLMGVILNHRAVATSSSHFALSRIKYTTVMPV